MRVAFFGNPDFAVTVLEKLHATHEVVLVVSNPDKKQGRKLALGMSPVKKWALEHGVSVISPAKLTRDELLPLLEKEQVEALAVAAYGKLLPGWLLGSVPYGAINVHASLLPEYRGAAPIERSLMDGRAKTGITIMRLDEGMDTGNTLAKVEVDIGPSDNSYELRGKLAEAGGELLANVLTELPKGTLEAKPQVGQVSFAPKISDDETWVDWSSDSLAIHNLVRALAPKPGAKALCLRTAVRLLETAYAAETVPASHPGEIVSLKPDLVVAAGTGTVILLKLQPPNKRVMTGAEFARGARLTVGQLLAG